MTRLGFNDNVGLNGLRYPDKGAVVWENELLVDVPKKGAVAGPATHSDSIFAVNVVGKVAMSVPPICTPARVPSRFVKVTAGVPPGTVVPEPVKLLV